MTSGLFHACLKALSISSTSAVTMFGETNMH